MYTPFDLLYTKPLHIMHSGLFTNYLFFFFFVFSSDSASFVSFSYFAPLFSNQNPNTATERPITTITTATIFSIIIYKPPKGYFQCFPSGLIYSFYRPFYADTVISCHTKTGEYPYSVRYCKKSEMVRDTAVYIILQPA